VDLIKEMTALIEKEGFLSQETLMNAIEIRRINGIWSTFLKINDKNELIVIYLCIESDETIEMIVSL